MRETKRDEIIIKLVDIKTEMEKQTSFLTIFIDVR
jgi:hypothetical protein